MEQFPNNLKYTKDHEWVKQLEDGSYLVGITHHAQDSLGDVTFVELPEVGAMFDENQVFGVVESVKAASDLFMPISGEVTERNDELADFPEKVNQDPYGDGWMLKISTSEGSNLNHLLDSQSYQSEVG
ncbi:MAG: glycine cleavage system protein GcvH [Verrucomicrobiota bacterium]|nr:glycine cleavage system protein GcvH [Verrucomicrobiota bacterium]|tara:strand:- start:8 stop:391 length:384 start_codon:yes stop_codon:yes gene_type:complete